MIRVWVFLPRGDWDGRDGGKSFWDRGHYPQTAQNGSSQVVVENVWDKNGGSPAAPFDQPFYLILDLAVGGTSGWFPDGVGNKPWLDGSLSTSFPRCMHYARPLLIVRFFVLAAMHDFAQAQSTWFATWPTDPKQRGMAVYVVICFFYFPN